MNLRNRFFNSVPITLLQRIIKMRVSGNGIALMYHEVLPHNQGPAAWTVVSLSDFRHQMTLLKSIFEIVSIDDAIERKKSSKKFQKPYAVVTFDDGYVGNLKYMLPVMEELEIPVTVYIATRGIEQNSVYWFDEIIGLLACDEAVTVDLSGYKKGYYKLNVAASEKKNWSVMQHLLTALKELDPETRNQAVGTILDNATGAPERLNMMSKNDVVTLAASPCVTIGGHSHCHNILPQVTPQELAVSIQVNREKLMEWTGQKILHFSYPNGDYNSAVMQAVQKAGYTSAVTTEKQRWHKNNNLFELPRLGVGRFDSLGLFAATLGQLT
jgi:peptidoglycan/xylan/chitin deacetylase (PgdA/CDA1 family)